MCLLAVSRRDEDSFSLLVSCICCGESFLLYPGMSHKRRRRRRKEEEEEEEVWGERLVLWAICMNLLFYADLQNTLLQAAGELLISSGT